MIESKEFDRLNKRLVFKDVEGKTINIPKYYVDIKKVILGFYPSIEEVLDLESVNSTSLILQNIFRRDNLYPIIELAGGHLICIDLSTQNFNKVYYVDFDFGVFFLDLTLDNFIQKLEDPIDYASLAEEDYEKIREGTYRI